MFGTKFQLIRIWQRFFVEQITAISVFTAMYTAMIVGSGLLLSSYKKVNSWSVAKKGSLILSGSLAKDSLQKVEALLKTTPFIKGFSFQTQEEYFQSFSERFTNESSKVSIRSSINLFPSRFLITLSSKQQANFSDHVKKFESKVQGITNEPTRFLYGGEWLSNSKIFSNKLMLLGLLIILIFALLTSYIGSVFSQKFISSFAEELKIKVMIGGKPWHTVGPIFLNTLILNLFSYTIAAMIGIGIVDLAIQSLAGNGFSFFLGLGITDCLYICLFNGFIIFSLSLLGIFSSWFKVRAQLGN